MTASTSSQNVLAAIADDMRAVDQLIRERLASEVVLINQISEYIINSGGKRLRPALLLLVAGALGVTSQARYELAAVIEFIHTSTLLHDDVVDESDLRRGKQTANALFGNAASVLVGDFLYSRSFEMMVSVDNMRVMQILARATNVIAEGEVLQLLNMHDPDVDEARYLQVIKYKTATLFEAATQLAAVLADADAPTEAAVREYGGRLGTAFQLMDDWLDYAGDTDAMGKNAGDDLREGKPTLPLIHVLQHGTEQERALVREAIENGGTDKFEPILAAITRTGALDYTLARAKEEADAAARIISALPSSNYKNSLLELCSYSIARRT
ncbi:polyprenyl synthetase family protein [Pandoraea nosoerga]|uniref:Octaprenyl diphosphate synthase n=2 Tax=Burkholderiaceae TaxID=119060 RepID=A0A5E4XLN5_9BURK|nr:polyprenyl synthetase family protein [Pandoraea nosoerga]MBN4675495.1 polyprenyl synthetase family protein [Pandoraea nosoerga]MBN4679182.1 polyprenyl synthetase family protein [Pandoraea nosoerga]MBN4743819.1 polyprenyl synthetase family protein [Pandoraea nosoerga]VVE37183.1 octaprenyl diphosphate synthase [Pandoraea nosoerga]